jgi:hypothetical protein
MALGLTVLACALQSGYARAGEASLDRAGGSPKASSAETTDTMGAPCPKDGIVLLGKDGNLSEWQPERNPTGKIGWPFEDGAVTIAPKAGNIMTKKAFRDFRLHLEFMIDKPETGRSSGNSGVYIQRRYEIQILNSFGKNPPGPGDCGAVYRTKAPDVNASRPAGEWQTFDIVFRAPRWDASGKKTENARITVRHNGRLIHNDVEIPNKTGAGKPEGPADGPILLQAHGSPVKFRNLWIVPKGLL